PRPRRRGQARAHRADAHRPAHQQAAAQARMALHRLVAQADRPEQAGEDVFRRPERHAHLRLPRDRRDGVPDEPGLPRPEVRDAGDGQETAAQGGDAGQTDHRGAGAVNPWRAAGFTPADTTAEINPAARPDERTAKGGITMRGRWSALL